MSSTSNYTKWLNRNDSAPAVPKPIDLTKRVALFKILDKQLSGVQFLKYIILASVTSIGLIIGINVSIDIYGLFLPVRGRNLPVYNNERISKYLLSYRYIPQNFNTAIIGTSLSANLDVAPFNHQSEKYRIYNSSLMGANVSELIPVTENLINGGVENLIICFSPYMIQNSGAKEVDLNEKLYYGALGSKNLYETYLVALIRNFEIMPGKFPKNQVDHFGVNHYEHSFKVENIRVKIGEVIEANKNKGLAIDPQAMDELTELIKYLNARKIYYTGYFHPVPKDVFESKRDDYQLFEKSVRELVNDDSKLIDFNTPEYEWFTSDYGNYIDHGHLSKSGQAVISAVLFKKFD